MIDLLIVLAFIVYSVASGFRARRKASESLREYFLAGKSLKGWQAGLSMAATQFAADTPLLVAGLIATGGVFLVWRLWIYGIAFLMMGFVFSASWRRAEILTDAELTEVRYSGSGVLLLRVLKAVYYGTVINCVVLAMVLLAAMRITEVFLPWHEWLPGGFYDPLRHVVQYLGLSLGSSLTIQDTATATTNNLISILTILSFTALYSTTGGLRSVVATDVMQFSLAMVGTFVYACAVIDRVGGLGGLTSKIVALYGAERARAMLSFGPGGGEALLPFLVLIGLQWFFQMNSDGTGYLAQRSMACETDRDARRAAVLFAWVQILARSLIWLAIGVGLLVLYPYSPGSVAGDSFTASREILFLTGIDDLLPVGLRGLMLTALLAALASTIDTHLNWGASYWSNDIYRRWICQHWLQREPKSRELVLAARLSNLVILMIALVVMANLGSIQTAWYISLLFGAGMGSVLVLRWLWERINLYSELAAIVTSLAVAPVLLASTDVEWVRLGSMALISTIVPIAVTLLTPPTDGQVLRRFYRRVRPQGFWPQTALAVGDDAMAPTRKLLKGLKTTGLSALSLFLLLVGFGKLMVRMPGESLVWAGLYLGMGLLLVPRWWRDAWGSAD